VAQAFRPALAGLPAFALSLGVNCGVVSTKMLDQTAEAGSPAHIGLGSDHLEGFVS